MATTAAIALICAADFVRLQDYPILRQDLANHLINLAFAGLVLVYVDTPQKIAALLRAFVTSSAVTTAVTIYSGIADAIPFESWIRKRLADGGGP
ncbi:MAG: hypothetical protein R2745_07150 [Vicinamibacterales bacterium]